MSEMSNLAERNGTPTAPQLIIRPRGLPRASIDSCKPRCYASDYKRDVGWKAGTVSPFAP